MLVQPPEQNRLKTIDRAQMRSATIPGVPILDVLADAAISCFALVRMFVDVLFLFQDHVIVANEGG